jgi:hypothetical protein
VSESCEVHTVWIERQCCVFNSCQLGLGDGSSLEYLRSMRAAFPTAPVLYSTDLTLVGNLSTLTRGHFCLAILGWLASA